MTEFQLRTQVLIGYSNGPADITAGPDGAMWFTWYTEEAKPRICRIDMTGYFTEYGSWDEPLDDFESWSLAAGPDGAMWFTECSTNRIGRITMSGEVTEFPVPTPNSWPIDIIEGPDGAMWFTEAAGNQIGRISTSGEITEFKLLDDARIPYGITTGPDGALWFIEYASGQIGRMTTSGSVTEFDVPGGFESGHGPFGITAGPDGAIWFTGLKSNRIGRISTSGQVREFGQGLSQGGIDVGPDGALWHGNGAIVRTTPTGSSTIYDGVEGSCSSIATGQDGALWFTIADFTSDGSLEFGKIGRARLMPNSPYYFAEGTCRSGFDTYFCIQNPNDTSAEVNLRYMKGDGTTEEDTAVIPAHSRATVTPRDRLGSGDDAAHDFATVVRCKDDRSIVVERSIYFNYKGKWTGGSDVVGASAPAHEFFFAEGSCRPGFDTYFCIFNPGEEEAYVELTYEKKGHEVTESQALTVPANSRATVYPRDIMGTAQDDAHDFSTVVESKGVPVVVERPMYFNYEGRWTGGSDVMGATSRSNTWYFAEGCTRAAAEGTFREWLCIDNPNHDADIHILYTLEDGSTISKAYPLMEPGRNTIDVTADVGAGHDVSISMRAHDHFANPGFPHDRSITAERLLYFDYGGGWTGGSASLGATPVDCYFAEGTCRPGFDTYFSIQNAGDATADVKLTYTRGDCTISTQDVQVPAHSRATIQPRDVLGTGDGPAYDFSTSVECTNGQTVRVERPMYFNYNGAWTGGHVSPGYKPGTVPPG